MIIAVEGIDGAGKNTLVHALQARFPATVLSFPQYETSDAARVARLALYGKMGDLTDSPYAMAALFALDRAAAREQLVAAAASPDSLLICDRYVASNAAYTAARLEDMAAAQWIYHLEFETLGLPIPALQVLLDTPTDIAASRAVGRAAADAARQRDVYERDGGLQDRTLQAYQALARDQWAGEWIVVPASTSRELVAEQIGERI